MLSDSPWEYKALFDRIFTRCVQLLSSFKGSIYLLIDEVGFRKKGKYSACVSNQYLGCIGKNDNGQVAVTAALSTGEFYCPVDMQLFMPQEWDKDLQRRQRCGIPDHITHQSKSTIALAMIRRLFRKLRFSRVFVVFDALYTANTELIYQLVREKISFVGEIRTSTQVFITEPSWKIPAYSGRGRRDLKAVPHGKLIKVRDYDASLKKKRFKKLAVREGTKGPIKASFHRKKVWLLHEPSGQFIPLHLLIRRNEDDSVKYCLGYATGMMTTKQMAKAQAQRVFVERVFEEGKNIAGMADYQVRSWIGFHRHMVLVSLALLFLMEEKIHSLSTIGKVTAYQIQMLIKAMIRTISSVDQTITFLTNHIPKYQNQISYQQKRVT